MDADDVDADRVPAAHAAARTASRRPLVRGDRATVAAAVFAIGAGVATLLATRQGPLLSPDSVTYLATAEHLRHGAGLTDFTGDPMTVFGPMYPLLLGPGGASLGWVRAVGALGAAVVTGACFVLARRRSTATIALVATAAVAFASSTIWVAGSAWSETTYTAIGLAMLLVLTGGTPGPRRAAAAGVLAGLGFLTRYAGAGLIVTGVVALLLGGDDRPGRGARVRRAALFAGAAVLTVAPWVLRNLAETGEALGPRFSGGATDGPAELLRLVTDALGHVAGGSRLHGALVQPLGWIVVAVVALSAAAVGWRAVRRRPLRLFDVAVVALAATCVAVPVVARTLTSNDIEARVMSPTLTALVLLLVIAVERARRVRRPAVRIGVPILTAALAVVSIGRGVGEIDGFPRFLRSSAANRAAFSPMLHDAIDALPPDAHVLTNNPQRVWWLNRREPTLFAFTQPRAGNSHYPLTADEVLALACAGDTYLAWFSGLLNAGFGPEERRPDLFQVVRLEVVDSVGGGTLSRVEPVAPASCPPRST